MKKLKIEDLNKRMEQLEHLAWAMFRALETYITYNERPVDLGGFAAQGEESRGK